MNTKLMAYGLILLIGLTAVGCAEKLTYQRWETVHDGMASDTVQATLGKPWQTTDQTWVYYDQDRSITAMIYFDQGKVVGKRWQDPQRGIQGKNPNVNQPGESERIEVRTIQSPRIDCRPDMPLAYRLLAVDVDGTLMDSRNELPAANREALQRAHKAGLYVCICTGRSLTETGEVLDQIGLDLDAGVFVFGAVVSDLNNRRTLRRSPIARSVADRLVTFFRQRDYPVLCLHDADQAGFDYLVVHGGRNTESCERWLSQTPTRVERRDEWTPGSNDPLRLSVIEEPQAAQGLLTDLAAAFPNGQIKCNPIYAPNYGLHVVECFSPEVNKWHGLCGLLERWNIMPTEVVAVGDDVNDVEMITHAGLGVAMGNAVPAVCKAAKAHAPTNDQCGLAQAIDAVLAGQWPQITR